MAAVEDLLQNGDVTKFGIERMENDNVEVLTEEVYLFVILPICLITKAHDGAVCCSDSFYVTPSRKPDRRNSNNANKC